MHAVNGRADLAGPRIELGDFLPERQEVTINGQTYLGWKVSDGHYPREVLAKLGRAYRRYIRVTGALLAPPIPPCAFTEGLEYDLWLQEKALDESERQKAADDQDLAYARYLSESAVVLIPGVSESEIDLVPTEVLEKLLRDLGYFAPQPEPTPDEGGTPEVMPPLTGAFSPDDSSDITESVLTDS